MEICLFCSILELNSTRPFSSAHDQFFFSMPRNLPPPTVYLYCSVHAFTVTINANKDNLEVWRIIGLTTKLNFVWVWHKCKFKSIVCRNLENIKIKNQKKKLEFKNLLWCQKHNENVGINWRTSRTKKPDATILSEIVTQFNL